MFAEYLAGGLLVRRHVGETHTGEVTLIYVGKGMRKPKLAQRESLKAAA